MITFLASLFIKDRRNYNSPEVRQAYGVLSGAVGIGLNILLFLGKWIAGTVSGSIAITADAFNNLSDAGSSIITLIGFRLPLSARVPTVLSYHSTGISTCCPSATTLVLTLGPDLPRADQLYPGNLGYSA